MKVAHLAFGLLAALSLGAQEKPEATEVWSPVPALVETPPAAAPSDALVLFDGHSLAEWVGDKGAEPGWDLKDGVLTVKPGAGSLTTRRSFADCQLHLEWRAPAVVSGEGQGRGNSGVYLQSRYEVQVLDSWKNPTYANGQAGSVYKQHIPLVNASRPPGEWQSYDIIFRAPRFNNDASLKSPAFVTVLHNGVLVQDHAEVLGATAWIGKPKYEKHPFRQPLSLQEHGNPVSYRNIWIRELRTESLFNGRDLTGWRSFLEKLGRDNDPEGNFKVEDGMIHIRGKNFGYIATEKAYENYHLKAEFRWGQAQWAPRATGKRDSGILYHFPEDVADAVWPKSIECQVQEGDCGDTWFVGTDGESPNRSEQAWGMKHVFRTQDLERPTGEWNTIEIICNGDQFEHYVNGQLVNSGTRASVRRGRILLQSEGAEVWYRAIEIRPF